jgi:hypothetical protein
VRLYIYILFLYKIPQVQVTAFAYFLKSMQLLPLQTVPGFDEVLKGPQIWSSSKFRPLTMLLFCEQGIE